VLVSGRWGGWLDIGLVVAGSWVYRFVTWAVDHGVDMALMTW
jgi:hypothetical protein